MKKWMIHVNNMTPHAYTIFYQFLLIKWDAHNLHPLESEIVEFHKHRFSSRNLGHKLW